MLMSHDKRSYFVFLSSSVAVSDSVDSVSHVLWPKISNFLNNLAPPCTVLQSHNAQKQ